MFSVGKETEQWYVLRGYRKSSVMFSVGMERAVVFLQGGEREQWYVFRGHRKSIGIVSGV